MVNKLLTMICRGTSVLVLCVLPGLASADIKKNTLIVGKLNIGNDEKVDDLYKRAKAISSEMLDLGIENVEIVEFISVAQMLDALKKGEVDWITERLFPALISAEHTDADIFPQRLKAGVPKFYSVFFVKKNSEVNSLRNLERKSLAFCHAFSSGCYFLPYYELNEQRYSLVVYGAKESDEIIGKRRIYYSFAKTEDGVVNSVLTGKSYVGAMSNHHYAALPPEKKDQLKIIHKTPAFIQKVEILRGDLELTIKKRLKQLVSEYNSNDERPVLSADNEKTNRFYKFVGEGRDGFVYLRSQVKHDSVPVLIEKKQKKKKKKSYFY